MGAFDDILKKIADLPVLDERENNLCNSSAPRP